MILIPVCVLALVLVDHKYDGYLPIDVGLIFLFGFLYYAIRAQHGIGHMNLLAWREIATYVMAYYLGYQLARTFKSYHWAIFISISGAIALGVLSVIRFALRNQAVDVLVPLERKIPLFWSEVGGEISITATGLGLYLSLGICLAAAVFGRVSLVFKWTCGIVAACSLVADILIQTRSPVYAGLLSFTVAAVLWGMRNRLKLGQLAVLLLAAGIMALGVVLYAETGIESFQDNPLFSRFYENGVKDVRYQVWASGIVGLVEYPLGGQKSDPAPARYFHNLWLDVGWYAGIFPVLALLAFTVRHFAALWRLLGRERAWGTSLGIVVSFFIGMMVEPVIPGYGNYFVIFVFIMGLSKKYEAQSANMKG